VENTEENAFRAAKIEQEDDVMLPQGWMDDLQGQVGPTSDDNSLPEGWKVIEDQSSCENAENTVVCRSSAPDDSLPAGWKPKEDETVPDRWMSSGLVVQDATMDRAGQVDCAEPVDKERFEAGKEIFAPESLEVSGGGKVAGNGAPVVELDIPDDQDGRKEERPRPNLDNARYQPTSQNPKIFENQEIFEPVYSEVSQLWEPRNFEDKSRESAPFQAIPNPRYLP
jgi:hypothetical protein